jgi:putative spermidine/putrescine transport system substrate-binding protein
MPTSARTVRSARRLFAARWPFAGRRQSAGLIWLVLLWGSFASAVDPLRADLTHDPEAAAFRAAFLDGTLGWDAVRTRAAAEGEVRWYHWGGSEDLNTWIDLVVAPELADAGVRLESVRVPATRDAVDAVLAAAAAGRGLGAGPVDLIWINGDNFRTLVQADLLFGPFADLVPNARWFVFDPAEPASGPNLRDVGTPTGLASMPWFAGQYVCYVDTARWPAAEVPRDHVGLEAWARAHPGRLTYVRPPDYIGTAFVQQALIGLLGEGVAPFLDDAATLDRAEIVRRLEPGFAYLRRLEPFLLGGGAADGRRGAPVYPPSAAAWERLFVSGEVDLACEDNVFHAGTGVDRGRLPETVATVVFPEGLMRVNKSFLAIPANAPNPAAALLLANALSSPESHLSKLELVGFPLGLDAVTLTPALRARAEAVAPDLRGVTYEDLAANAVAEMHGSWVPIVDRVWARWVAEAAPDAFADVVGAALTGD